MITGDERKYQPCLRSSPFPRVLYFSFAGQVACWVTNTARLEYLPVALPVLSILLHRERSSASLAALRGSSRLQTPQYRSHHSLTFRAVEVLWQLNESSPYAHLRNILAKSNFPSMAMHRNSVGPRVRMGACSRKFHLAYLASSFRLVAAKIPRSAAHWLSRACSLQFP